MAFVIGGKNFEQVQLHVVWCCVCVRACKMTLGKLKKIKLEAAGWQARQTGHCQLANGRVRKGHIQELQCMHKQRARPNPEKWQL